MSATPARLLVEAFGDVPTMVALYHPDITWRLSDSLPENIRGPHLGAVAVEAFNNAVFTEFYQPGSATVEIHDELGTAENSVVRFSYRAVTSKGHPYDVEYVLFAKAINAKITEVIELLDTRASTKQHAGDA